MKNLYIFICKWIKYTSDLITKLMHKGTNKNSNPLNRGVEVGEVLAPLMSVTKLILYSIRSSFHTCFLH